MQREDQGPADRGCKRKSRMAVPLTFSRWLATARQQSIQKRHLAFFLPIPTGAACNSGSPLTISDRFFTAFLVWRPCSVNLLKLIHPAHIDVTNIAPEALCKFVKTRAGLHVTIFVDNERSHHAAPRFRFLF